MPEDVAQVRGPEGAGHSVDTDDDPDQRAAPPGLPTSDPADDPSARDRPPGGRSAGHPAAADPAERDDDARPLLELDRPPGDRAQDASGQVPEDGSGNGREDEKGGRAGPARSESDQGRCLSTGCPPLDALLEGGLERDAVTLVFGEGGSGKTNLALQCARQVATAGKKVAFVDTEGVSSRRLEQVFEAAPAGATDMLLFYTPYSISEQERTVEKATLPKGVGLIVVDSINMHYRLHMDDDEGARDANRSLYKQLHHLTGHARRHGVPVLITGQVYGGEDATQPFARRTMEHLVKALIRFEKRPDGSRRATVLKHRSIEDGRQARFRIDSHGLVSS